LVPTAGIDPVDVIRGAPLALSIQPYGVWSETDNVKTVYMDADPHYTNVLDLAPFSALRNRLVEWQQQASSEGGCIDLASPTPVSSPFAPGDEDCPALLYIEHFRGLGMKAVARRVIHDGTDATVYDGRDPEGKTLYFRVLMNLPDRLRHNESPLLIPKRILIQTCAPLSEKLKT
jgi:hypothetical protein